VSVTETPGVPEEQEGTETEEEGTETEEETGDDGGGEETGSDSPSEGEPSLQ